ncbi:MAG: AMP-binding protein [Sedimenticola sp.]
MSGLTPLSRLLCTASNNKVAVDMGRVVDLGDLQLRVQGWLKALQGKGGSLWSVYHSDAYEFLSILLALWQLERTASVAGDICPGTVARLQSHVDGFVGEFPDGVDAVRDPSMGFTDPVSWNIPKPTFSALEIYTSGSTGDPKPIIKTISQLEREVEVLESLWPSNRESVVLATVSHQHLYGMTFRLFWPVSAGRAFERRVCEYSEDIFFQAKHYPSFSLVSSPSHLGRMNSALDWDEVSDHCHYLISSAAPLSREDSIQAGSLFNAPVREIYGSSEAGAVAWRTQSPDEEDVLWQPLPSVLLSLAGDSTLAVQSPYLGELESLTIPDRVDIFPGGRFRLVGRVDGIVKIEGKRVSLAAIERQLIASSWVKNVKVLTLERKRVETAVVLQLTPEGERELEHLGRKVVVRNLKQTLVPHFEAVILPRRWRFVEQMPFNPQGKLPLSSLRTLFEEKPVEWPDILSQLIEGDRAEIVLRIPPKLLYFDGHFEGHPILPGVVQVHWAEAFGRRLLPLTGRFDCLEVVKFQQVIMPEYQVALILEYRRESGKLVFEFKSEKGVHSSGRICFIQ